MTGMRGISAAIAATLVLAGTAAAASDQPIDDAHRAAARRLIEASRIRERQDVALAEGIRAAQAELAEECVARAAEGRSLAGCDAPRGTGAAVRARLEARRAEILDEIVAAAEGVYARQFDVEEMNEIARFFRSPVGRKYAERYPTALRQVGAVRRPILRRYIVAASVPGIPRP